jgi:proline iminopeptidase
MSSTKLRPFPAAAAAPRVPSRVVRPSRRWQRALTAAAPAIFGLLAGLLVPRGPSTSGQAVSLMVVGVLVGGLVGYAWRTRWAILLAPLSHAVVVELVRLPLEGPTVDAIRFGGIPQLAALALGRGWYGLVVLIPMGVAAAYGAALGEGRRVRRVPGAIVGVMALAFAVLLAWPASTAPILDPTGAPLEGSIAELTTVELGGHEQTVLLRGHSTEAPVLLYLVGGPGGSQLGHVRATMEGLEEDVVLAVWEQRGTGTSYPALDPTATHTLEGAVADTIELAEHLRDRFGQDRIYLLGSSWGTILGTLAVQERPDLFHAYLGAGQMVDVAETDRRFHDELLAYARRVGDGGLAAELDAYGPPPYADVTAGQNVALHYSRLLLPPPQLELPGLEGIGTPEYGLVAKRNVFAGLLDTYAIMYPQLAELDLRQEVPRLEVPVYLVQGELEAPGRDDLARAWFEMLEAPVKELVVLDGTDHVPHYQAPDAFRATVARILDETSG